MFQSLLTFIRKQNYLPFNASNKNIFFFTNCGAFLYKLTNWVMWYTYTTDALQAVTLRVYNKDWNKIFMTTFFTYSAVLIILMSL